MKRVYILLLIASCFIIFYSLSFPSTQSLLADLKLWDSHSSNSYNTLSVNTQQSSFSILGSKYLISHTNSNLDTEGNLFWPLPFLNQGANVMVPLRISNSGNASTNEQDALWRQNKTMPIPALEKELTDPKALLLRYSLYEQAITVVKNRGSLIPFQNLDTLSLASLNIGQTQGNYFQDYLSKYASFQHFSVSGRESASNSYDKLINTLAQFKVVVIGLHDVNPNALQAYGISQNARTLIERLRTKTQVALVVFGSPYSLKYFDRLDYLVCTYENNSITQKLAPQILFGAMPAIGKLPVTVTASLKAGTGITTTSLNRLGYSIPERVGLHSSVLQRIDDMVENYIQDKVMPGAQVLVAKHGKVVFEKAYGHLTYDKLTPVTTHTLYDLASVTKVAATLQAVMSLQAQGKLDINQKASHYLPELKETNKEDMLIRDLLLHQAGLLAFQDYWTRTKTGTGLDSVFYSTMPDEQHPLQVAPGIYGLASLKDSLWHWTIQSRLLKKHHKKYTYKYSDLGFDILQQVVERLVDQPMDQYLSKTFYQPLGLDELLFNPLSKFKENRIAPTEMDDRFRGTLVRGTVHDQAAALMGGVAGHAGLFGTANDLAILMQMNLQKGYYGGKQYLSESTIPAFTKTYQADNRRGLGWDRLAPEGDVSTLVSPNSFGHTGFTGTCVWVDPDEDLVYIFLSNRVYPNVDNTKLARYKVREKIQHVIYTSKTDIESLVASSSK